MKIKDIFLKFLSPNQARKTYSQHRPTASNLKSQASSWRGSHCDKHSWAISYYRSWSSCDWSWAWRRSHNTSFPVSSSSSWLSACSFPFCARNPAWPPCACREWRADSFSPFLCTCSWFCCLAVRCCRVWLFCGLRLRRKGVLRRTLRDRPILPCCSWGFGQDVGLFWRGWGWLWLHITGVRMRWVRDLKNVGCVWIVFDGVVICHMSYVSSVNRIWRYWIFWY